MTLPKSLDGRLRLPAIVAPMFLISGPDLVVECCKAGLVGTFPALNQRSSEGFDRVLAVAARHGLAGGGFNERQQCAGTQADEGVKVVCAQCGHGDDVRGQELVQAGRRHGRA